MLRYVANAMLALEVVFFASIAHAVMPFAVSESELAVMPRYCHAKYGKDRDNPTANQHWQKVFGVSNWRNMHHYCDVIKFMLRAERNYGNINDRTYYLTQAERILIHQLEKEQTPDWLLRPEAHVKLGRVILKLSRLNTASERDAVVNFEKALQIKPNYLAAYYALSDYYASKENTEKALSIVEEGLKHVPQSKGLKRRQAKYSQ